MNRRDQFSEFCTAVKHGKSTVREAIRRAALVAAADERSRTLDILRKSLPKHVSDALVARITILGVLQVCGLEPLTYEKG